MTGQWTLMDKHSFTPFRFHHIIIHIQLINMEPVASFSEARLTTSSGKHLGKVNDWHTTISKNEPPTSFSNQTELMYGFPT